MYDSSLKHTEKIIHIILSSVAKDASQALFIQTVGFVFF